MMVYFSILSLSIDVTVDEVNKQARSIIETMIAIVFQDRGSLG